jgi:hypothetical protein
MIIFDYLGEMCTRLHSCTRASVLITDTTHGVSGLIPFFLLSDSLPIINLFWCITPLVQVRCVCTGGAPGKRYYLSSAVHTAAHSPNPLRNGFS